MSNNAELRIQSAECKIRNVNCELPTKSRDEEA